MKNQIVLLLIIFSSFIIAQNKIGSVKFGLYNPSATDNGFIIGYEGGWFIDNNFLVGWSVDWFHKNYTDSKLVKEYNDFYGTIYSSLNEVRAKTNLHSIPLMGIINGNWYIANKTKAFVTAAAGINPIFIFYRNYENPDNDEFQAAIDFAWRVGTGVIYEIGENSDSFLELTYHNSNPSWEFEVKDAVTGKRKVLERKFEMSGIIFRLGFRFYF
ncbi:hypothetical protein [Stygiobacter electus]|uniref:Outer membrane protein beta-barrel domain-containing protein n=1 Tax=Stygiobacter electus TaxID=3032292 RepID=A0AAE3TCB9_9BACT|nr:hypothetical protein [Stygiobacter electus]MDF1611745.1 hypothetical protein [Stygiobacter electus]